MEQKSENDEERKLQLKHEDAAQSIVEARLSGAHALEFIMERFEEFVGNSKEEDWKTELIPLEEKFKAYMENLDPGVPFTLKNLVKHGLGFISCNPLFSIHELAEIGAPLRPEELQQFVVEVRKVMTIPSKRKQIHGYIAACGHVIVKFLMEDADLQKAVETKKTMMTEVIASVLIKKKVQVQKEPWLRGLRMLERLADHDIEIDKDGNVLDPKGLLKVEEEVQANYARVTSSEGTPGESPESVPPAPESLS